VSACERSADAALRLFCVQRGTLASGNLLGIINCLMQLRKARLLAAYALLNALLISAPS
jgi:hypothetical protein